MTWIKVIGTDLMGSASTDLRAQTTVSRRGPTGALKSEGTSALKYHWLSISQGSIRCALVWPQNPDMPSEESLSDVDLRPARGRPHCRWAVRRR